MKRANHPYRSVAIFLSLLLFVTSVEAQKKKKTTITKVDASEHLLWTPVDVPQQDLFFGPGGTAMQPDVSRITFIKEEKGGHSKKFRIKDGSGNTWVAKVGNEAQPETAAVRLLSAIGYKTEINYLVPNLTIPGKGSFTNVRLEARPANVQRGKQWYWGKTPFEGTHQMKGLMLMMAFINNWDMKSANNVILKKDGERHYVISDLGVSFGRTGRNSLPLFWRIGRSRNNPGDYAKSTFIRDVKGERVKISFNGKNRSRMKSFTRADARWLAGLLTQLSDSQIRDAFRAANYSPSDVDLLFLAVQRRIRELDLVDPNNRIARSK
jgi:hypothetical protein